MVEAITEPESLDELRDMSKERAEQIDKLCWGDSLSTKAVIREIIRLADEELSWQGRSEANSLRDFWYNPTKPILEKLFPEKHEGAGSSKFNRRMSQALSETMSEMVKDGETTYKDLNILDDSREREINTRSIESDKVLFVEKDSAYRKLKPLEKVYGISIVSGSGWQATALIEDMVREMDTSKEYTIYLLSDHDPTGHGIAEDFADRAELFGVEVERVERIGVKPEQVDDETVEQQKFHVAKASEEWVEEHGINGEAYGLEIEAVGGSLENKAENLRKMVVKEIKDDIRTEKRRAKDRASAYSSGAGGAAKQIVQELENELTELAAEIIEEESEVVEEAERRFGGVSVTMKTEEEVLETDEDIAPEIYEAERLHRGAVNGRTPRASSTPTKKKVKEELVRKIDEGEVEVEELVGE